MVQLESGDLVCSPFHVRFGKLQLLRPSEKVVELQVNGNATGLGMKVGEAGEAFFVIEAENPVPSEYATSPIQSASSVIEDLEPFSLSEPQLNPKHNSLLDRLDTSHASTVERSVSAIRSPEIQSASSEALTPMPRIDVSVASNTPQPLNSAPVIDYHEPFDYSAPIRVPMRNRASSENLHSLIMSSVQAEGQQEYTVSETDSLDPIKPSESIPVPHASIADGESVVVGGDLQAKIVLSTSPSNGWSWSWGGLPEKTTSVSTAAQRPAVGVTWDASISTKELSTIPLESRDLKSRSSTPVMKSVYAKNDVASLVNSPQTATSVSQSTTVTSASMSVSEKVHSYLEGLPPQQPLASMPPGTNAPPSAASQVTAINTAAVEPSIDPQQGNAAQTVVVAPINVSKLTEDDILKMLLGKPCAANAGDSNEPQSASVGLEISQCGSIKDLRSMSSQAADALFNKHQLTFEQFCEAPTLLTDPSTVFRFHGFYHTWQTVSPMIISHVAFGKPLTEDALRKLLKATTQASDKRYSFIRSWWGRSGTGPISSGQNVSNTASNVASGTAANSGLLNAPVSHIATGGSSAFAESSSVAGDGKTHLHEPSGRASPQPGLKLKHQYIKSLRLNSDQLKSLNLRKGRNTIEFTVKTKLQGKAICTANLFFWNYDTRIVISDIDGTITKSDVLGHMLTMVGRDWTHAGVASLYTSIHKNGYQFLYLTSRAIGQADSTREYLKKVEQNRYQLPEGPVIMSPDRLLRAFHREVILRKPEEFKIACLRDIKRLFGNQSPFYAGFGNRITDALSYRSVDVPSSRIFTVDPSGELKLELMSNFKSSYVKLNAIVDHMFPPINQAVEAEYTDFNFWKSDLPEVRIDIGPAATNSGGTKNVAGDENEDEGSLSSHTTSSDLESYASDDVEAKLERDVQRMKDLEEAPFM